MKRVQFDTFVLFVLESRLSYIVFHETGKKTVCVWGWEETKESVLGHLEAKVIFSWGCQDS